MHTLFGRAAVFALLPSTFAQTFVLALGNYPAKGDGDFAGGIFSVSLARPPKVYRRAVAQAAAPKH